MSVKQLVSYGIYGLVFTVLVYYVNVGTQKTKETTQALYSAAQNGYTEKVSALIKAGADVNAATRVGGSTPLAIAAQNGHTEIVFALLKAGADVNAANKKGATPLFIAALLGHEKIVFALNKGRG